MCIRDSTSPSDASGIFGALIHNVGTVDKLLDVSAVNLSSGSVAISRSGASSSGVTASGNIAVSIDWSGSLATTDLSGHLVVEYRVSKA